MASASPAGLLYLDTSAAAKIILEEPESDALAAELGRWDDAAISALTRVELPRAIARRRHFDPRIEVDEHLLFGFFAATIELALNDDILDVAATLPPPSLRALDAIHLASALSLAEDLAAIVTYDTRMLDAAHAAGPLTLRPS